MIVEKFVGVLSGIVGWMLDLLPVSSGTATEPPGISSVLGYLADVNSLIPIGSVITAAVVVLAFLIPAVIFRLVVVARHILLP